MRILFVTGSLVHGGAERQTITLANRLAERGHECHFVYVKNDPSQRERLKGTTSVRCLHAARYLDLRALRELRSLAASVRPDVVVAANQYALMYAWLAVRSSMLDARLAVVFHSTVMRNLKEWLQMLYYRPLFWSADRLVFVCESQMRFWQRRKLFGRSTQVIHNGVDIAQWTARSPEQEAMRRALSFNPGEFVIGLSAVLRPEKNPLQLVEAIAILRRRGIPARALFIGDGEMRAQVEIRARQCGVVGDVLITGYQKDVRPLLAACDAAVLCSTAIETFSLAALEAMALGKPVVHADIGGAPDMIRSGVNGYLFPVGDTAALVECLAQLADPERRQRMGRAARETVEARFSESAMVDGYERALLELCGGTPRRGARRKSMTLQTLE